MPLYFAAGAVVIETVIRRLTGRWAEWAPLPVVVAYVLVSAYQLDATSRGIQWSQATRETQYKRIAAELAASRSDCPLAALEIGALAYYYPGPILDLAGIISPESVGQKRGDVLRESSACWLVTYDENLLALDPTVFDGPWFSEQFTLRESLRINERRSLVVYARTGPD